MKSISQCTTNVLLYQTMRWVHNEDMLQSIFMIYLLSRLTEGFGTIFSFEKWVMPNYNPSYSRYKLFSKANLGWTLDVRLSMMFWVFTVIIKLLVWLEWLKCSRVMSPWWMPPPGHTSSGPGPTVIIQIVMREENIWGICRPRLHIMICDWHT